MRARWHRAVQTSLGGRPGPCPGRAAAAGGAGRGGADALGGGVPRLPGSRKATSRATPSGPLKRTASAMAAAMPGRSGSGDAGEDEEQAGGGVGIVRLHEVGRGDPVGHGGELRAEGGEERRRRGRARTKRLARAAASAGACAGHSGQPADRLGVEDASRRARRG